MAKTGLHTIHLYVLRNIAVFLTSASQSVVLSRLEVAAFGRVATRRVKQGRLYMSGRTWIIGQHRYAAGELRLEDVVAGMEAREVKNAKKLAERETTRNFGSRLVFG